MANQRAQNTEEAPAEEWIVPDDEIDAIGTVAVSDGRVFTDVELHDLTSFDDALKLISTRYAPSDIVDATDIGDGFQELDKTDKQRLVGVPFIMLQSLWREGDFGERGYYTCHVITQDGRKYRFSDGSTGIGQQLTDMRHGRKMDRIPPMVCRLGLSSSTYPYTDPETNKTSMATTFYIDTATPL